jgi:ubiquinone/menaquinone biosynthesis C-methylase UbiE
MPFSALGFIANAAPSALLFLFSSSPKHVSAWTFTAVPPSTNPSSKLNRLFIDELANKLAVNVDSISIEDGRIRFEPSLESPPYIDWSFESGVRSIRVVAGECFIKEDGEDEEIDALVERALQSIDWDPALQVWQDFGNDLPRNLRVHVNCRKWQTSVCRTWSSTQLNNAFARALCIEKGWQSTSKRNAHMEIHLLLHSSFLSIEIPLLFRPVNEMPHPGMKQVESFCVARSADIRKGDVVLDPMCGKATFLVEAAACWPHAASFMGIDHCHDQLRDAKANVEAVAMREVTLLHGDSRRMDMIETESVDVILCCPPFGRQFGNLEENEVLYRELLLEWSRVLKTDSGRMVLLVDETNVNALTSAVIDTHCSIVTLRHSFRLGKLHATIVICQKLTDVSKKIPGRTKLPWELMEKEKEKDRALWSKIRSKAMPSLVPINKSN